MTPMRASICPVWPCSPPVAGGQSTFPTPQRVHPASRSAGAVLDIPVPSLRLEQAHLPEDAQNRGRPARPRSRSVSGSGGARIGTNPNSTSLQFLAGPGRRRTSSRSPPSSGRSPAGDDTAWMQWYAAGHPTRSARSLPSRRWLGTPSDSLQRAPVVALSPCFRGDLRSDQSGGESGFGRPDLRPCLAAEDGRGETGSLDRSGTDLQSGGLPDLPGSQSHAGDSLPGVPEETGTGAAGLSRLSLAPAEASGKAHGSGPAPGVVGRSPVSACCARG